jgi:hypothetical protein
MYTKLSHKVLLLAVIVGVSTLAVAAQQVVWSVNNENRAAIVTDKSVARQSFPTEFKLFNLNVDPLRQQLFSIVDINGRQASTVISLPNADGGIEYFEVYEASNFEPELQAQFPEIRAFSGRGLSDKYATLKLSISPQGIQTMVFRTEGLNEFIEAYSQDRTTYAVFRKNRAAGGSPWECSTDATVFVTDAASKNVYSRVPESNTGEAKTMRLAQSCNGEYSNFFGATSSTQVALVLAAFNGTMTRTNGSYERDLGIHLNLIPTTTNVIYYDPATDPYTTLGAWNNQLQATLTANIGEANYDIGHMFGASGGGGNAGCIGCVCVDGQKGRGITSPADAIPMGDNFDIDYVAHEIGHQMGANHTFSQGNEGTGVNKEVGSGITVMGYAGITGQDVAPHSIDTFHQASIQQIQVNMATKTCPVNTVMTLNGPPVVAPVSNYTIPISTPFALTGSATDPQGDALTYQWEQNDNSTTTGNASVASPTKATGPNWLSFPPTASPTRYFPRLQTVQSGLFVTPTLGGDAIANTEALSSISRTLNFRLTVRDNKAYVPLSTIGQTQFTDMVVTVTNTAGPFKVTSPNTAVTYAGGSSQNLTWDVAGTNTGTVNVANVRILYSTDGGNTFPTVVNATTPNDGAQVVTIPVGNTTTGRIKVESIGNVFYDMSDANFTVTGVAPPPRSRADFDGDGRTDLSVFRPTEGNWYLNRSTDGFTAVGWGISTDTPVPGDYDNDAKTDVAVFRPSSTGAPDFYVLNSATSTVSGVDWGTDGDIAIVGDYDGDSKADPAVYRPSTNTWYILNSNGGVTITTLGAAGAQPLSADFDADGKTDIAYYRPSTQQWIGIASGGGSINTVFGTAGDKAVPADYDGDFKDDFAVYRPSSGTWHIYQSSTGTTVITAFGISTDIPVPGDYDGDGREDIAVYRNGTWYLLRSTSGLLIGSFGLSTDVAIPSKYIP